MRPVLVLALLLPASACGARTDLLFGSDAGSSPPSLQAGSPAPPGTTTETAIITGYGTGTYANSTTAVFSEPGTGTAIGTSTSGSFCTISPSNYDQTCAVDTDCTVVPLGNFCMAAAPDCSQSISVSALPQYSADVAKTPLAEEGIGFGCAASTGTGPCCRQSLCTTHCAATPSDTLAACAMAGGTCRYAPAGLPQCPSGVTSGVMLAASTTDPPCLYADEACCGPVDPGSPPPSR